MDTLFLLCFAGKAASEEEESGHISRVKSPPTELLVAPSVKEPTLTQVPPGLQAAPKSNINDSTNPSSITVPASEFLLLCLACV